jgi:hypothetical protein
MPGSSRRLWSICSPDELCAYSAKLVKPVIAPAAR